MTERNLDAIEAKLLDANTDVKTKFSILTDIRDGIEHFSQGALYPAFLKKLVPALLSILDGPPVFLSTSPEQRLRSTVLEILHRLPTNTPEITDPYAPQIVDKCMELIKVENEDNAVTCLKTITDIQRHHTKSCGDKIQPFLNLILEIFATMEQSVHDNFDSASVNGLPGTPGATGSPRASSPSTAVAAVGDMGGDQQQSRQLPKGMQSFKLIAECPIIVVTLFQANRNLAPRNVEQFIARIRIMLQLQAAPQRKGHEEAAAQGESFTRIAREIATNPAKRAAFGEFITAQVKTMSFLAYLMRVYQSMMQDFIPQLPDIVIRLLQDCPREKSATRKELLVAIRHIINFNFRTIFLPRLDDLMDEKTLIGDGLTVYENSRFLAYTMLADLVHHVRDQLSQAQIRKTIVVYTKNLHDDCSGANFQTMSAKLLFNMAECMAKSEDKKDARYFLIMVLDAVAEKCASMNREYKNAVKISARKPEPTTDALPENYFAERDQPPDWDETDIYTATPIKTTNSRAHDPVSDNKVIFKNMVHGLKTIFFQLRTTNPPDLREEMDSASLPSNWNEISYGFNAEEIKVLQKLFHEGALMFRYFSPEKPADDNSNSTPIEVLANQHMMSSAKEEKELLEAFAGVFHHIDPSSFYEIFQVEIPHLYDMIFGHAALLHIPQFLLASEGTSPPFCGMLLQFLMGKLDEVGTADVQKSSFILRLFKLSFMAVTLFSTQNEPVLLPHVVKLITRSIELSVHAEEPMNYFVLLRSLFRSIGGGRFEHLYKEILPLLEMLLEVLNNLLVAARKPQDRDLFVELSLTVPARLSHLLPHLSYLMRPVVVALRAGSELIAQGLRTLELCVDNLTADYLDPIMAPVIDDLMAALWDHLKPAPYSHFHSHTTLRILGKLGGRNRKFLTNPPQLEYRPYADDEASFDIKMIGTSRERPFPVRLGYVVAIDKLKEAPKAAAAMKSDAFHKQQSLQLIKSQIKLLIDQDQLPDDFAQLVRLSADDLFNKRFDTSEDLLSVSRRDKSAAKRDDQQEMLSKLIKAMMFATSVPELKDEASAFLVGIYRHFTLLEFGRALAVEVHKTCSFDLNSGEGPVTIDSRLLADAIADSLSSDNALIREEAAAAMQAVWQNAAAIFGDKDRVESLAFFNHLLSIFVHHCYEEDWFVKSGGVHGILLAVTTLGFSDTWLRERQGELVSALMFVMKDMPHDLPATVRIKADELLQIIVRKCNTGLSIDEIGTTTSSLHKLCNRLVMELSHLNKHVRKSAQDAFALLAEVLDVKVWEVVKPVKELVLGHIFNKPLRALPFNVQIGYIDALTFCLDLENEVLEFEDRLNRCLLETLALVDADDDTLAPKPKEFRSAESIVALRISCLRLLNSAIKLPAFNTQTHQQHRSRIITVFFRCLYARNPDVSAAANAGLRAVLEINPKLPKELLQTGLRPILMNVQDPKKLSVEGLEGLRTLLQLLTTYFRVEIGARLLDHMGQIADPQGLQKVSFSMIELHPKIKLITAIFSVFHLLPAAAVSFLPTLVERVLVLEKGMRRTQISPFRDPLVRYLAQYPTEAWTYFSSHLKDPARGRFLAQILADPQAKPLRKVISEQKNLPELFNGGANDAEKTQIAITLIGVFAAVSSFEETAEIIKPHELIKAVLMAMITLEQKLKAQSLIPQHRLIVEQIADTSMKLFVSHLRQSPGETDFLFTLIKVCTGGQIRETHTLSDYIYQDIIDVEDVDARKVIAKRCIETISKRNETPYTKRHLLHNILNPMLAKDIQKNWDHIFDNKHGTNLLDKEMVDLIHEHIWKPHRVNDASDDVVQPGIDHSRMEIMQLTALLLKYHHEMLADCRRDVIVFAWVIIRLEDIISKNAAYCTIAYFIAFFEAPPRITNPIYRQLLSAHQTEGRALILQALEIYQPVLKKRLGDQNPRQLVWARMPRKVLSEEPSSAQHLTPIYQFIIRYPDLFYEMRESFTTFMIPTFGKLCSTNPQVLQPSPDGKRLILNLCTLIWQWESKSLESQGAQSERSFIAAGNVRLAMIKYMVQFVAILTERFPVPSSTSAAEERKPPIHATEVIRKTLALLHKFLAPGCWDDLDIDSMFPKVTETTLLSELKEDDKNDTWTTRIVNTLQLIRIFVNVKSNEWVLARLPQLQKLLSKLIKNESVEIQDAIYSNVDGPADFPKLKPIMQRILECIPLDRSEEELPDADDPGEEFLTFISTTAGEAISSGNHLSSINVFWCMSERQPDSLDTHIPALLKALQSKLAKDHLAAHASPQAAAAQGATTPGQPNPHDVDLTVVLIIRVIDMLSARITILGDQRRPYLSVLASIVERSSNNALCTKILDMADHWIFNSTEPVPTLKEKTAVLQKMLYFEHRSDTTLYTKFLDLVIRIYEDPKIHRTELAVRMEQAFLIGLRSTDIQMRNRFMTIFDRSLSRTMSNRFYKLIAEQQWDVLADSCWLSQVVHLMFGSIDFTTPARLHAEDFKTFSLSEYFSPCARNDRLGSVMLDNDLEKLVASQRRFMSEVADVKTRDLLDPLANLQHIDWQLNHDIWVFLFPICWSALAREDREDIEAGLISLVTKDFHNRQADKRPNCIQTLLEGITRAKPRVKFPSHVMKFQAKNFDAWYTAATFIEDAALKPIVDTPAVRESNLDALVELYSSLQEDDLFYGTWRRRCQFVETNAALSYEQNGVWDKAQHMYEQAQVKARVGSLAYHSGEYMLWEDHWVFCAEKLQQWEILSDFAKHENLNDLFLEATWRNYEAWTGNENREQLDTIIKAVSDAPTPRRLFFSTFMSLLRLHGKTESLQDFNRACDDNIQLSIRQWHKLPKRITKAHISLLQNFQSIVELHDASVICNSLAQTNQGNLDGKSQELKLLLGTWRDRLPNFWDDINAWQDLVTWRQHIFQLINGVYLGLIPSGQGSGSTNQSYAYRGYHETAWIINRFAHVARKHQMPDVCINQLSRIYTLPNIEIQEAFLKLREQAKCHYQNRAELNSGLEVINNTNLNYFGPQQKAEFYTLKGMFLAKLNQKDEANDAFGTALFFDIKLPKAWAEWGRYNDDLFKEDPQSMDKAANAISCYLEAAGQYKSAKARKLLSRILWLLSLDDAEGKLAKAWEQFKGETPVWYWITFIPQLLNNLSRTPAEAEIAHGLLSKLAKTYPQALYFQLRTSREDMQTIKRSQEQKEAREKKARAARESSEMKPSSPAASRPASAVQGDASTLATNGEQAKTNGTNGDVTMKTETADVPADQKVEVEVKPKKPWDHTEELMQTLKTAFPLLALSMETIVDQVQKYLKCLPDEDAYRLIVALLNDGLSYLARYSNTMGPSTKLPGQTESNLIRFSESVLPAHIKSAFEADFVVKKPTMLDYIGKLRKWRDRFEERLDRRANKFHLKQAPHLAEFRFHKFDEVEIPGQYLLHKDKNQDFVRIERFMPDIDLVRGVIGCSRRLRIRGHDGSVHPFAIQHPTPRTSRREERILQLFRVFNSILAKKKESRRRNLQFHLPIIVPLSPGCRMLQDDASYVSLQAIYEDFCRRNDLGKDDAVLFHIERMRGLQNAKSDHVQAVRIETFGAIQEKYVPPTVALDYFKAIYPSYDSLWLFRRQFSHQMASLTFLTFTMFITLRYPSKMNISRGTGQIWGAELVPAIANQQPRFNNSEPVPFRLTPNLQTLMGPIHTEGIFVCALMAIARCLTETNSSNVAPTPNPGSAAPPVSDNVGNDLESHLSIFVRDEMSFWYTQQHRSTSKDGELRENVQRNTDAIVNKAVAIAGEPRAGNLPASQSVLDLVARASEPRNLGAAEALWMPWL